MYEFSLEFFERISNQSLHVLTKKKKENGQTLIRPFLLLLSKRSDLETKEQKKGETSNRDTSLLIFHATGSFIDSGREEQKPSEDSKPHLATRESSTIKANRTII